MFHIWPLEGTVDSLLNLVDWIFKFFLFFSPLLPKVGQGERRDSGPIKKSATVDLFNVSFLRHKPSL